MVGFDSWGRAAWKADTRTGKRATSGQRAWVTGSHRNCPNHSHTGVGVATDPAPINEEG